MKYIEKKKAPPEIKRWLKKQPTRNGQPINCSYENDMPTEVKTAIRKRLLAEQGGLCCYTGISIDFDTSHIEHLIPQSVSRTRGTHEDIDYTNMLAAYPGNPHCGFGAKARGDKPLKVHPLQPKCQTKFRFDLEGHISPSNIEDTDTKQTIEILVLTHGILNGMRQHAIDEALLPNSHALSQSQLRILIQHYSEADSKGHFRKFCFVITQAAQELLHKAARDHNRRVAIHRQGRK